MVTLVVPCPVLAADFIQIPGGGIVGAMAGRGGGRGTHDIDGAEARLKAVPPMPVIVTIENEIGPLVLDDPLQLLVVLQRTPARCQAGYRRMMDEDHAIKAALAQIVKEGPSRLELALSQSTAGAEERLRHGAGQADERDVAALSNEWEKMHPGRPDRAWAARMSPVIYSDHNPAPWAHGKGR